MQGWIDSVTKTAGVLLGPKGPAAPTAAASYAPGDFSIHFFLQLAVILVTCRVVGWFGKRFLGQPQVVGEMIAGVVLGPSLLAMLVMMAIATTMMASPLFELVYGRTGRETGELGGLAGIA